VEGRERRRGGGEERVEDEGSLAKGWGDDKWEVLGGAVVESGG